MDDRAATRSIQPEGSIFVHFDAAEPDILCCQARLCATLQISDVVAATLPVYNELHDTNYAIADCELYRMVDLDDSWVSISSDSLVSCGPNFEVLVVLPDRPPLSNTVSEDVARTAVELGFQFLAENDPCTAMNFFATAGETGRAALRREAAQCSDDDQLRRIRRCQKLAWRADRDDCDVYEERLSEKSDVELMEEFQFSELNYLQVERLLRVLVSRQTLIAIKLILRDAAFYRLLPKICWENSKVFEILNDLVDRLDISGDSKTEMADLLIDNGLVSEGLLLGYNFDLLKSNASTALAEHKLWLMFVHGDNGPLYLNLQWFFMKHSTVGIGQIHLLLIHDILSGLRGPKRQSRPRQPALSERLPPDQIVYFRAICIAGCFLFVQGFVSEYLEIRGLFDPDGRRFFDPPQNTVYPEWEVYRGISLSRPNKRLSTPSTVMCVIGDESVVYFAFDPVKSAQCDSSMVNPIFGLSIWGLRPGKNSFESSAFWNHVKRAQKYPALMIVIGKRDLLEYIPRLVQSGKFMNVKAAMLTLARVYRGLMLLIHTKYPAFKLFIGRILTSRDDGIPAAQREAFQEMVRSSMPEEVGILI